MGERSKEIARQLEEATGIPVHIVMCDGTKTGTRFTFDDGSTMEFRNPEPLSPELIAALSDWSTPKP